MADAGIARTRARLCVLEGDRQRAAALLRLCHQRVLKAGLQQEAEQDRYMLGLLIEGAEGAQLVALARKGLSACGIADPDANMRAYAPELLLGPR